jgi:hypothetical protein
MSDEGESMLHVYEVEMISGINPWIVKIVDHEMKVWRHPARLDWADRVSSLIKQLM